MIQGMNTLHEKLPHMYVFEYEDIIVGCGAISSIGDNK